MKKRDHIEYWIKSANNDLTAAEVLLGEWGDAGNFVNLFSSDQKRPANYLLLMALAGAGPRVAKKQQSKKIRALIIVSATRQ